MEYDGGTSYDFGLKRKTCYELNQSHFYLFHEIPEPIEGSAVINSGTPAWNSRCAQFQ